MRKWIIVFFYLIYSLISLFNTTIVSADSNYARIIDSTYLYKNDTLSDEIDNIICIVEKTYFVEIISEHEEYFHVHYNGISGYIKKSFVREITNTPSTPYPDNIKLTIESPCNLRSSPTIVKQPGNVIATLPAGENNFTFIGRIFSDEAIDFGGTTWYYVKYNDEYGYIYNKYVKSITPIYENIEEVTYKDSLNQKLVNPL